MELQVSLFDIPSSVSSATLSSPQIVKDPDSFGCCSRFRSCSDARKCLISHLDYSAHCAYRKNLESGLIFYGKNANAFSLEVYSEYCQRVEILSNDVREECYKLLTFFFKTKPGTRRILVDNAPYLPTLVDTGLFSTSQCQDYFLRVCSYRKLLNYLKADPVYGQEWKSRPNTERTKKALVDWIKENAVPFLNGLINPYRMVELCGHALIYGEELYQDFLLNRSNGYIAFVSPLVRDGWVGKDVLS